MPSTSAFLNQNNKNPFVLVEAMPLVECLHACPFEQAQRPSLQPPHQSLWDSNQDKRKTTDLAVLKNKVSEIICVLCVICERTEKHTSLGD